MDVVPPALLLLPPLQLLPRCCRWMVGIAANSANDWGTAALHAFMCCPPVLQREDIERLFKEVTDKWGTVNVLVNNAVGVKQSSSVYL